MSSSAPPSSRGQPARTAKIDAFILQKVTAHPGDIAKLVAERFGISRQAVNRHLKRLIDEGKLVASGATRSRQYSPVVIAGEKFELPVNPSLDEHDVWRARVGPRLEGVTKNVSDICHYGFTEMLNNVVDHSRSSTATVTVSRTSVSIIFVIHDDGVGIFRKISAALALPDERFAVLELSKGKLTTDPKRHSGEGIFFTSRMFDTFMIESGDVSLVCTSGKSMLFDKREPYQPLENSFAEESVTGTRVIMKISTLSGRTMTEVFDRFSDTLDENYGFVKTLVPVSLARFGDENLVSRSQAKRLLARFERFKEVVLDFSGVETVGQAFADEIFRVFPGDHPNTHLLWINTTPQVEKMIRRAIAARTSG
ncbi:STAS-like domain-containing protein [Chondromyces apiculatus]|uniref:STAS-like domain-containing protein n=1 Tax=Chondromyces apiculatus TaxID=51 RepID=UPI000694BFE9|nr:DUF4325 domain-containing protein [Chondromyces apiculatus]